MSAPAGDHTASCLARTAKALAAATGTNWEFVDQIAAAATDLFVTAFSSVRLGCMCIVDVWPVKGCGSCFGSTDV